MSNDRDSPLDDNEIKASSATVSVVVVNFNGRRHLEPCFRSLLAQDYPSALIELILIDNNSQDDSLEIMAAQFPRVKVIQNAGNVGFARAVNQGAALATGRYLALINNDARADAHWLTAMVSTLEAHREQGVVCVGAQILDWEGQRLDFVSGGASFYGMGCQFYHGFPIESTRFEAHEALFACGGAMLVEREVFLCAGGFDEDYFAYYEDVDFGWRLWVLGYKVLVTPAAIIYHRHHGTSNRMQQYQIHKLFERNALMAVIKNYEDANLYRVLSSSLLFMFQRILGDSVDTIDWDSFDFIRTAAQNGTSVAEAEQVVPKLMLSPIAALKDVIDHFPQLWQKRLDIQSRRARSDAEILPHFHYPLGPHYQFESRPALTLDIVEALGIRDLFAKSRMHRILIISTDPLYENLTGIGLRALEMARCLGQYCYVTLAAPERADISVPDVQCVAFQRDDQVTVRQLASESEVIIFQGYSLLRYPGIGELNKILVADLYDPYYLEGLELFSRKEADLAHAMACSTLDTLNQQLRVGDFFLCASERQRDFWLGMLTSQGRLTPDGYRQDPTFRTLIDVAPFGIAPDPPRHQHQVLKGVVPGINPDDTLILWGGGIWDWLDPLTVIRAMKFVREQRPDLKLFFLGYRHPNPVDVPEMEMHQQAVNLAQDLDLYNQTVFFNDRWVPYAERSSYLLEADIGVSAHLAHVETRFAFRTRLLDYIWAGLPMVVTAGDTLADIVTERGLGYTVAIGDAEGFAQSLLALAAQAELRAAYAEAFAAVREEYTWEQTLRPLIEFCRNPRYAADRRKMELGSQYTKDSRVIKLDAVVAEKNAHIAYLEDLIKRMEAGRVMRLLRWLTSITRSSTRL